MILPLANRRAVLALGMLAAMMAGLYTLALLRFPLATIYRCALQNLDKLSRPEVAQGLILTSYSCPTLPPEQLAKPDPLIGLALAAGIMLLFVAYLAGAALLVRGLPIRRGLAGVLLVAPLVFATILLLVYPLTSLDLYDYAFRGRMLVHYGANNFVSVPNNFGDDPLYWYTAWRRSVTAYGPLWEAMSWLTARLAGQAPGSSSMLEPMAALLRLLVSYKLLALAGFVVCGVVIWLALGQLAPERRWLGLYLWLWNPLALWESLAAGHNDAWMAALLVLAVWAAGRAETGDSRPETRDRRQETGDKRQETRDRRPEIGDGEIGRAETGDKRQETGDRRPEIGDGGLKTASGAELTRVARQTTVYHLPSTGYRLPSSTHNAALLALVAITLGGLIKYSALFFGPALLALLVRRLPNARTRLWFVLAGGLICSGLVLLAYAPFWVGLPTLRNFSDRRELLNASWLAALQPLLMAWMPKDASQTLANLIGLALLLVGIGWSAWRAWQQPDDLARHMLWLLLWFLFIANPWFQPWYLLWALALVAVRPRPGRLVWAIGVFCCTALLSYPAGTFLLTALGWKGDSAAWNALVSLLIYTPPLLILLGNGATKRRAQMLPGWHTWLKSGNRSRML